MTTKKDFREASDIFRDWFTSQAGTTFHPSLELIDLRARNAGRGIVAIDDIPADTDLFTIPRSTIISEETSELAKKLPGLFESHGQSSLEDVEDIEDENATELPSSWLNLILILIYEYLHDSDSHWSPYLSVLPQSSASFNTLMFWDPTELSELQASAFVAKVGRDSADKMFKERIIPIITKHANVFYPSSTQLSHENLLQKCHAMGSLIMSYAFDLQPDEDEDEVGEETEDGWVEDRMRPPVMGMVPMADMLNADAEFNAHLSHGEDKLTMTSLREIKAGEEVLNYYGPLPNGELLRRYGYTSHKHSRYDVVEISWDAVKQAINNSDHWMRSISVLVSAEQLRTTIIEIEKGNDYEDLKDGFVLEREAGDPDEQGFCTSTPKFTKFPDELVTLISGMIESLLKSKAKKRKVDNDNSKKLVKRATLDVLAIIVRSRLEGYQTSIDQDEALLTGETINPRLKMAINVRLGEKRLLKEALVWTEEMQKKYLEPQEVHTNGSASSARSVKRRQKQK